MSVTMGPTPGPCDSVTTSVLSRSPYPHHSHTHPACHTTHPRKPGHSTDQLLLGNKGSFREDLFYRISVVTMTIHPLRERREDISVLIDCFVERYAREDRKQIAGMSR